MIRSELLLHPKLSSAFRRKSGERWPTLRLMSVAVALFEPHSSAVSLRFGRRKCE